MRLSVSYSRTWGTGDDRALFEAGDFLRTMVVRVLAAVGVVSWLGCTASGDKANLQ